MQSLASHFVLTGGNVRIMRLATIVDETDGYKRTLLAMGIRLSWKVPVELEIKPNSPWQKTRIREWLGTDSAEFQDFLLRAKSQRLVVGFLIHDDKMVFLLYDKSRDEAALETARTFARWLEKQLKLRVQIPKRVLTRYAVTRASKSEESQDYALMLADFLLPGVGSLIRMVREWFV